MQAMILAAGLGTRLLPHTALRPKPMFPVLNTPLLLATIRHLQACGCRRIVVNCHHLREQIVQSLAGLAGVLVLEEPEILGTGGGLRNALPFLFDEPLLVTNGDIYHDIDIRQFYERHCRRGGRVSLAVHDWPRFNSVLVDDGRISAFAQRGAPGSLAFTGLHVLAPEILEEISPGRCSCIIDRYRQLLEQGEALAADDVSGCFWTDMGTEADYLALHGGLLRRVIPCWPELRLPEGERCIDPAAQLSAGCHCEDWLALGAVHAGNGVRLARVVAWDGVVVAKPGYYHDQLLSSSLV